MKVVLVHKKCNGTFEFNWANQFTRSITCDKCNKNIYIPTTNQLRERPELRKLDWQMKLVKEVIL